MIKHAQLYASEAHKGDALFIEAAEDAYLAGATWANEQSKTKLAALRAENAKLREALQVYSQKGYISSRTADIALESTIPDPLYLAAPEMLVALERCHPYMNDLDGDNFEDVTAGIFQDKDLTLAVETMRFAIKRAKGEPYP